MTTHEKIKAVAARLASLEPARIAPELAGLVEGAQILRGLGIPVPNPLEFLLPDDPLEADELVDKLIALLFDLRGDDLPPFDPSRYGESLVAELLEVIDPQGAQE